MVRQWQKILCQYGQSVTLRQKEGHTLLKAFIQPVLEKDRAQEIPSPLGMGRQELFLYLGPAAHPLDMDTVVECNGREYRVQRAHKTGEGICPYWWAVLYPRDGVRS